MKEKIEALKQASYKLAEQIYKQSAAGAQGAEAGPEASAGDAGQASGGQSASGAEDADYRVVDDDDKK